MMSPRALNASIIILTCMAVPGSAEITITFQGEPIDMSQLRDYCEYRSQLAEDHPEFQVNWKSPEECLSAQILSECRKRLLKQIVEANPPSETEIERKLQLLKDKDMIPECDRSLLESNRILKQMLKDYRESRAVGEKRLREIYDKYKEEVPEDTFISWNQWRSTAILNPNGDLECESCFPSSATECNETQKAIIRSYLARREIAEGEIESRRLMTDSNLRRRVAEILDTSPVGANLPASERTVDKALRNALREREWELWVLGQIEAGVEIEGDSDLTQIFSSTLEVKREEKSEIANYQAVFFPPWE